jgi:hypothetical protein
MMPPDKLSDNCEKCLQDLAMLRAVIDGLERRIKFSLGQHYESTAEWKNHAQQTLRWLETAKIRLEKNRPSDDESRK